MGEERKGRLLLFCVGIRREDFLPVAGLRRRRRRRRNCERGKIGGEEEAPSSTEGDSLFFPSLVRSARAQVPPPPSSPFRSHPDLEGAEK